MSFFNNLFRHKNTESVVLIDIGASSVAGAYVQYKETEPPTLLYNRRVPIEPREGEPHGRAMLRALSVLGDILIQEGAPVLAHAVGKGTVDLILVAVDSPWAETTVRTEHFEEPTPFIFSKSLVTKVLEKSAHDIPEKLLADESVIGTILNGYETGNPYGKKVHRASAIVLTSLIEKKIANTILSIIQNFYHTKRILPITGSSLRYQAMRTAFPHEQNALILDATGPLTSIILIRKGLFVAISEILDSVTGGISWVDKVIRECAEIAKNYPLPRTIFLLAQEPQVADLEGKLDTANLGSLWLSDNPPKTVSILASHIASSVRHAPTVSPDLLILLMTLYYETKRKESTATK
jgi:hypothetical protein